MALIDWKNYVKNQNPSINTEFILKKKIKKVFKMSKNEFYIFI